MGGESAVLTDEAAGNDDLDAGLNTRLGQNLLHMLEMFWICLSIEL